LRENNLQILPGLMKNFLIYSNLTLEPVAWKPFTHTRSVAFVTIHFTHKCFGKCQILAVPKEYASFEHHRGRFPAWFAANKPWKERN